MAREAGVAKPDLDLIVRQAMLGSRILVVLHGRHRLLNQGHSKRAGGVAIGSAHVAVLAGLRLRILAKLVLETAVEPLEVSQLFQVMAHRFLVHDWKIDGVTTAAHPRGLNIRIVFRLNSESVVHRIGHDDVVLERSQHLIRLTHFEQAGDRMFEEML